MRVWSIRSRASFMSSGGRATAVSATTSTDVPPAPNRMIGPKSGSSLTPTISSWAPGRSTIACTREAVDDARSAPWRQGARRCPAPPAPPPSGERTPRTTPPTSDLWLMSRDRSFTAIAVVADRAVRRRRASTSAIVAGDVGLHHRHAEGGERGLGLRLAERRAPVGRRRGQDRAGGGGIDAGRLGRRDGGVRISARCACAVAGEIVEAADGVGRRIVGGDAAPRAGWRAPARGLMIAEPAGEDRLERGGWRASMSLHRLGDRAAPTPSAEASAGRAGHDQQGVDIGDRRRPPRSRR